MFAVSSRVGLLCLVFASAVWVPWLFLSESAEALAQEPASGLVAMPEEGTVPELALLMGELQRLTHKLALSADAGNAELAAFYLFEIGEQLRQIQTEAPEYEGLPVAVLIDRLAHPAHARFQAAMDAGAPNRDRMLECLDGLVQSCNTCHMATQHGFVRITRGTDINPFNQSFDP